jgi:antitoxin component YwqK of YwqJK toxin-antitoxin module
MDSNLELIRDYWPNGKLYQEGIKINGKIEGVLKQYDMNGNIEYMSNWLNGKLHGDAFSYFPDGSVWTECTFVHHKKVGPFRAFYPDGQLEFSYDNMDGKLHGVSIDYSITGKVIRHVIYSNNSIIHQIV